MSVSTRQRRERILGELYQMGRVSAKALASAFDVSEATIRRDLRDLAKSNQVQLVYGGASIIRPYDFSFGSKMTRNVDAKKTIGRLASALVNEDDTIFLDSGTTCYQLVPYLRQKHSLRVIVNSARLALELDVPGLEVILIGGHYRPKRMDTTGPLATGMLEQLRGYLEFVGADGLSKDFGLTAVDVESAHLYRTAMRQARQCVLLVDHTKFDAPSLFKVVGWETISKVVTDMPVSSEWEEFFAANNIELIAPSPADSRDAARQDAPSPRRSSAR
jgi:DeoR family transcriptional regulator of aga operon